MRRLRRRLAELRQRHLYAATSEARASSDRADGAINLRAPPLWNDLGVPPSPPVAVARELRATDADVDRAIAALAPYAETIQQAKLRACGPGRLRAALARDALPVPAAADREHYFDGDDLAYWLSGYGDFLLLAELAELHGRSVLDFGSSSGRVLRHLHTYAGAEVTGVDIGVQAVAWARHHLPFPVVQGTVLSTLPFADAAFDVIFAGSVFTHIDQGEEAWLAELRRVLKPDGVALVTFHPERLWTEMHDDPGNLVRRIIESSPHRMEPGGEPRFDTDMPADRVVFTALTHPVNNANVMHSRAWIETHWDRWFTIAGWVERAHGPQQDLVILR